MELQTRLIFAYNLRETGVSKQAISEKIQTILQESNETVKLSDVRQIVDMNLSSQQAIKKLYLLSTPEKGNTQAR